MALVGPRQVGKTSILERIFPKLSYVSLDVGVNAEVAETRPQEFLQRYPPPVLLDEVQYAPSLCGHFHDHFKQWLSVLQSSNQIYLLEPYFRSLGKRLAKSPKLFFTDTGLAAFLMGFSSPDALWSQEKRATCEKTT